MRWLALVPLQAVAWHPDTMISPAVSRRQGEIGVRMALGADRGDVLWLVVRQGATLVATGIILGLLGAATAIRLVESVLFGVTLLGPLALAAGTTVLLAVALLACWLPALRATRINPVEARSDGA